jgi:SAM-dependent methyltransferase
VTEPSPSHVDASALTPALDPSHHARLRGVSDAHGRYWSAPLAAAVDVRRILAAPGHEALLPGGTLHYPADDATLDQMAAKVALEGVLVGHEALVRQPTVAAALASASRVFEAGIGAGSCTIHLLEALGDRSRDGGLTTSDGGMTGLLGLANLARAGARITAVPAEVSPVGARGDVLFRPWLFDDPPPVGVDDVDLVVADNTLVYVDPDDPDRAGTFARRVAALHARLRPGGLLALAEIDDEAPPSAVRTAVRTDLLRMARRGLQARVDLVRQTLAGLRAGGALRDKLAPLQLPTRQVVPALRALGDLETVPLQHGLVRLHLVRRSPSA